MAFQGDSNVRPDIDGNQDHADAEQYRLQQATESVREVGFAATTTEQEPTATELEPDPAVHWYAARFPLLKGEEFEDLVESIRANGLRDAIVLDMQGQLIDGRNRLPACKLAEVKPWFVTYEGDSIEFIRDKNVIRRHMSKGQQAMAVAIGWPNAPDKGGRGKTGLENIHVFSRATVKMARYVVRYAPELADKVLMNDLSLTEAHEHAVTRKRQQERHAQLRQYVLEEVTTLVDVCEQVRADAVTMESALSHGDLIQSVRLAAAAISDCVSRLKVIIGDASPETEDGESGDDDDDEEYEQDEEDSKDDEDERLQKY
jgi:hypothetical protein